MFVLMVRSLFTLTVTELDWSDWTLRDRLMASESWPSVGGEANSGVG